MLFELSPLPYGTDSLEPFISKRTVELHHGRHQLAYVTSLNSMVGGTKFNDSDLETIIKVADGPLFNYASQVWNHKFYFESMIPSGYALKGPFSRVISGNFGSVQTFRETFMNTAASLFGSGWVWLIWNPRGAIEIVSENNAGNPMRKGMYPLLACDVWEHCYYLDYQNRRLDYVSAFWKIINWELIEKRYNDARSLN